MTEHKFRDHTADHDHDGDCLALGLDTHFRADNSPEIKQLIVGHHPVIVIEVDVDGGNDHLMPVKMDITGFDPVEVADMLHMLASAIEHGIVPKFKEHQAEHLAAERANYSDNGAHNMRSEEREAGIDGK